MDQIHNLHGKQGITAVCFLPSSPFPPKKPKLLQLQTKLIAKQGADSLSYL